MSNVALGNPENYTIGGMRFYFSEDSGDATTYPITAVDDTPSASNLTITGGAPASRITISGSTGNDGTYNVSSYTEAGGNYTYFFVEDLPDATVDGDIVIDRDAELYLGNVVTGSFTSDITFLDHFTSKTGTRQKDRSIVQEISVAINLTLDEPNVDNMNLFMLGGAVTITAGSPVSRQFAPYTNTERNGGARLAGVSDTGNEWVWTVNKATVKPDGDFTYDDQDWSQFNFIVEVLSDSDTPSQPFGVIDHYGVDEDIDVSLPLPDNA